MKRLVANSGLGRDFPIDDRYLIGVSGGRDSVALLHRLITLGYRGLIVCHLNHQLRGRSSNADLRFVKRLAHKHGLTCEFATVDVRGLAKRRRMSIETAARDSRYSFFAKVAKRRRCRRIFLAHHADDLVETFLINLFRGAGMTGLAAMRETSARRLNGIDLVIVRPLLGLWRREIDKYVHEHGLRFREDASNKNLNAFRNRIRHRVIPYLEKTLGRNIRHAIWRAAVIAGEEETWIENQSPSLDTLCVAPATQNLSVERLGALPVALQRRTILKWLRGQNISEVGFDVIEGVRSLIGGSGGIAKVNLPRNRHARRRAGRIFVE